MPGSDREKPDEPHRGLEEPTHDHCGGDTEVPNPENDRPSRPKARAQQRSRDHVIERAMWEAENCDKCGHEGKLRAIRDGRHDADARHHHRERNCDTEVTPLGVNEPWGPSLRRDQALPGLGGPAGPRLRLECSRRFQHCLRWSPGRGRSLPPPSFRER